MGALEISAADWAKMEGLRPDAISKWEGWTGQTMDTTNLVYLFELEHFVINLSVTYTNGFVHNFCHVALSDYVEP